MWLRDEEFELLLLFILTFSCVPLIFVISFLICCRVQNMKFCVCFKVANNKLVTRYTLKPTTMFRYNSLSALFTNTRKLYCNTHILVKQQSPPKLVWSLVT